MCEGVPVVFRGAAAEGGLDFMRYGKCMYCINLEPN